MFPLNWCHNATLCFLIKNVACLYPTPRRDVYIKICIIVKVHVYFCDHYLLSAPLCLPQERLT